MKLTAQQNNLLAYASPNYFLRSTPCSCINSGLNRDKLVTFAPDLRTRHRLDLLAAIQTSLIYAEANASHNSKVNESRQWTILSTL